MNSTKKICLLLLLISSHHIFSLGEKVPFALLKKFLPHNPVILEAGAQFGEDTEWMSEMWPEARIYSFEPNPESYADLQKRAAKLNNVSTHNVALSNTKGTFPFYICGGASSLLRPTDNINEAYFHSDLNHPIMVNSITLDEWAAKNNVTSIDFMWLDMEGNELRALHGALGILPKVKIIYTEVNLLEFWHGCVQYDTLKKWLEDHGFTQIWADIVPNWHGNVLFINNNL